MARSRNGSSVKGTKYSFSDQGFFTGGRRDLMARFPKTRRPRIKKPVMRIVQPKPTLGRSCWTRIGSTTPPTLEPVTMIPNASARCFLNQVPAAAMAGDLSVVGSTTA